jgi:cell division transport system permease protein
MRTGYLIKRTFELIFRKWKANLILVVCLILPFLVMDAFLVITANLWSLSQKLKGDVEIEIFLKDDIAPQQTRSLREYLLNQTETERLTYRSQKEAYAEMRDYLGEKTISGLDSSTFPASFQLGIKQEYKNFRQVSSLADRIKNRQGVEGVELAGEWVDRLDRAVRIFLTGDLVFGLLVGFSVMLMVANFMRISIFDQTKSIRVMSLLGASRRDIYIPLISQGVILGGAGAWLGVGLIWSGYVLFSRKWIHLSFLPLSLTFALIFWGMILGGGGSLWSVKKQT